MTTQPEYDNVQRTIRVLRDTFGSHFKTYYDGDPEAIPLFNLPAIIVTQTGDETAEAEMGEDDVIDRLTVKVVFNKRDDFKADRVDPLNTTQRKIRELIARRSNDGKTYAEGTVKYAIRSMLLADGVEAVANNMSVEYGIRPRPGGDGYADLTEEGHVSFGIQYSIHTY